MKGRLPLCVHCLILFPYGIMWFWLSSLLVVEWLVRGVCLSSWRGNRYNNGTQFIASSVPPSLALPLSPTVPHEVEVPASSATRYTYNLSSYVLFMYRYLGFV